MKSLWCRFFFVSALGMNELILNRGVLAQETTDPKWQKSIPIGRSARHIVALRP